MRQLELKPNNRYIKCPHCENNTKFTAHSAQVGADTCEVWVVCKCGYDPTEAVFGARYEDVLGGTHDANIRIALECWNDAICELDSK